MKLRKNAKILGGGVVNALFAATCLIAQGAWAALWNGGAEGRLDDSSNWVADVNGNDDPATSEMFFTDSATVSLDADMTAYSMFPWSKYTTDLNGRTVTFNLGTHTLSIPTANTYWRSKGSTYRLESGTFSFVSGSTTNTVAADNANTPNQSLVVTGTETHWIGNLAMRNPANCSFKLLDGATFHGQFFCTGGVTTNEVSGGSKLIYNASNVGNNNCRGMGVGAYLGNGSYSRISGGSNHRLVISGEGTLVAPADPIGSPGFFAVGSGSTSGVAAGTNSVVVKDGATLVLPQNAIVGHGVLKDGVVYRSDCNELVVTGSGSSITNLCTNSDTPTAIGRWGSYNRFVMDNGATGFLKCLSCGGAVKNELTEAYASVYTSVCNRVTIDHGSVLDAQGVSVGNQHSDFRQRVAQCGSVCYSNVVEVLGGSALYATNNTTTIGSCAPYFGNAIVVSGSGSKAEFGLPGNGNFRFGIGAAGSCSNRLEVLDGASVVVNGPAYVGRGVAASGFGPDGTTVVRGVGNVLRVEGAGSSFTGTGSGMAMELGVQTNGNANVIYVGDGATFTWNGYLRCYGFDNMIVVSNATLNVGTSFSPAYVNNADSGGRLRMVFAGDAPKMVCGGTSLVNFRRETTLRFEVPAAGWSEVPLQVTGTANNVSFENDTRLEIDAKAFSEAGGGEVPLVTSGKGLTISDALLESWNADLEELQASVRLSDDGKTLKLKVKPPAVGTTIVIF